MKKDKPYKDLMLEWEKRRKRILTLHNQGKSMVEIAGVMGGISRQRIFQIVKRNSVD